MKIAFFPNAVARNGQDVMRSLLDHCRSQGHQCLANDLDADMAIIWSMLWHGRTAANQAVWQRYRALKKPVMVLEIGVLRRGTLWRVGINGVNASGYHGPKGQNSQRAEKLGIQYQPWRSGGNHVLICLQHDLSEQWSGMPDTPTWLQQTITTLGSYTDRPVRVRPHPRRRIMPLQDVIWSVPNKISNTYDDFDHDRDFRDAWAVINHNSNPGVQAVMQGIPAFVGQSSLAAPVANLDLTYINGPVCPDRRQWLNDLAWCEWTREEIAQGLAWRHVMDHQ